MSAMIPCPGMQCGVFEHKGGSHAAIACGSRTERTRSVASTVPKIATPDHSDEETREYIRSGQASRDLHASLSGAGVDKSAPEGSVYADSIHFGPGGFDAKLKVVGRPDLTGSAYTSYPHRMSPDHTDASFYDNDPDGFVDGWEQGEFREVKLEGLIECPAERWAELDVAGRFKAVHDHFVGNLKSISASDVEGS